MPSTVAFRPDIPSVARVYDALLGGKDNLAVDRAAAAKLSRVCAAAHAVQANRDFLVRAVRYLASSGLAQYLDLGVGLPAPGNVHEVAQEVNPDVRTVYVDHDRQVLAHARARLAGDGVGVVAADVRYPQQILTDLELTTTLDLSRPVAVVATCVLHFVSAKEDPAQIITDLFAALVPGSALVVSHAYGDPLTAEAESARRALDEAETSLTMRSRQEIGALFAGFDLVEPGLEDVTEWRPDDEWHDHRGSGALLAGVGILRSAS